MVSEASPKPVRWISVGRLLRPFGVRGEIRARIHTIGPDLLLAESELHLGAADPPDRAIGLQGGRVHGDTLLLRFQGFDGPETVRELTGLDVWLPRESLPEPEEGEYYWDDLIGLRVEDEKGGEVGVVENLFATGANDVMTVRRPDGSETLLPFIDDVILQVDLQAGTLTVHLMHGL